MGERFDPYVKWLGIRDPRRPPHHYRLLGLELFENDPEVIQNAADRQLSYVRRYLSGQYSGEAKQLIDELIAARACLLNPSHKSVYDEWLRKSLAEESPPPVPLSDREGVGIAPLGPEADRDLSAVTSHGETEEKPGFFAYCEAFWNRVKTFGWQGTEHFSRKDESISAFPLPTYRVMRWYAAFGTTGLIVTVLGLSVLVLEWFTPRTASAPGVQSLEEAVAHSGAIEPATTSAGQSLLKEQVQAEGREDEVALSAGRPAGPSESSTSSLASESPSASAGSSAPDSFGVAISGTTTSSTPVVPTGEGTTSSVQEKLVRESAAESSTPATKTESPISAAVGEASSAVTAATEEMGPSGTASSEAMRDSTSGVAAEPEAGVEASPVVAKIPVPDSAAVASAEAELWEVFKNLPLTKGDRSQVEAILAQLGQLALSSGEPAQRYVIWRRAIQLASEAGLVKSLSGFVEQFTAQFDLEKSQVLTEALATLVEAPMAADARKQAGLESLYEAIRSRESGRFDDAELWAQAAQMLAQKAKNTSLIRQTADFINQLPAYKQYWQWAEEAKTALRENPNDAAAHTNLGVFLCFYRHSPAWEEGLLHLGQGENPVFRELAEADRAMAPDATAGEKVAIGDRWYAEAQKAEGRIHEGMLKRAIFWYQQALPQLTGFTKVRVERLLQNLAAADQATP